MLEGKKWDESQFDLKRVLLNFRKYISKADEDIFGGSKETNDIDTVKREFGGFLKKNL